MKIADIGTITPQVCEHLLETARDLPTHCWSAGQLPRFTTFLKDRVELNARQHRDPPAAAVTRRPGTLDGYDADDV